MVARLLGPALLLLFALVFPGGTETASRSTLKLVAVYSLPVVVFLVHLSTALKENGFLPWLASYVLLTKIEFGFLALCFLAAGLVFYRNYREAPSGVLRQQLKWLTGGTLAGTLPVSILYIRPFVLAPPFRPCTHPSPFTLALIPLTLRYAIVRYR